jgi:leukotriene-A4 hydrolase
MKNNPSASSAGVFMALCALLLLPALLVRGEIGSSLDPSSYSNVDEFEPTHLSFEMEVNFDTSQIDGVVTHSLTAVKDDSELLYMDVWDAVTVNTAEYMLVSVSMGMGNGTMMNETMVNGTILEDATSMCPTNWTTVPFEISTPNANIGNALAVTLPCTMPAGTMFLVRFTYVTQPDNLAISWMTPEQTAGKVFPYMYSLCQLNFCRDFAPMMDTPSQKITYDATVISPKEVVAKMSANITSEEAYNETHTVTTFDSTIKIPSYLIAIVVGDLVTVPLDDRVSIISEPAYIDGAVAEFEEMPQILDIVEKYLTPYAWGSYAIVIMPPSFAWGGMEHPMITFASPTLVVGDKSRVDVAIHELTHSWFGNDVGCQNWGNFWINEGMNTFMERKTLSILRGPDKAKLQYYTANVSMAGDIADYGEDNTYTSLNPDIGDDDPENSFSSIPYEKGSQFMYYIESLLGEEIMEKMLREYLTYFQQQAITQQDFYAWYEGFVLANFDESGASNIINMTMWDTWVTEPGYPPVQLDFYTEDLANSEALAGYFMTLGNSIDADDFLDSLNGTTIAGKVGLVEYEEYFDFSPPQKLLFVQTLRKNETGVVNSDFLTVVDAALNIISSKDPGIRTAWCKLGIEAGYEAVMDPCYDWLGEQGRSYYVTSTFRALVASDMCDTAVIWFEDRKDFYNSYVMSGVARALEPCVGAVERAGYIKSGDEKDASTPSTANIRSNLVFAGPLIASAVTVLAALFD